MSDFLSQQQCDELVNGQTYNGEYVPTDQDLADMNEAWDLDNLDFNEVMGYDKGEQFFCDYEEIEDDTYQDSSYYDDFDQPEWME